ncbi:MAG: hypothetical protein B5M51_07425, partial [Anaerolinea sp. 4484_236]
MFEREISPKTRVATPPPEEEQHLYFFNSPQGRAAVKAIQEGNWRPGKDTSPNPSLSIERPNIFQLYEENIGPLTPLIADALRDAESIYSATWIEEAIAIAVKNNVRKWNYIEAILHSWKEEGRYERKDKTAKHISKTSSSNSPNTNFAEHSGPGDPNCELCGGMGYLRRDVPMGHPDFGKLFICKCRQTEIQ